MPNDTGVPAIAELIHYIRGHRVMLDEDLARIYGVETRIIARAVRRNLDRFPEDFMFRLKDQEVTNLRSQFGISRATDIAYSLATGESLHFPLIREAPRKGRESCVGERDGQRAQILSI
jgi:hypothetical protein